MVLGLDNIDLENIPVLLESDEDQNSPSALTDFWCSGVEDNPTVGTARPSSPEASNPFTANSCNWLEAVERLLLFIYLFAYMLGVLKRRWKPKR